MKISYKKLRLFAAVYALLPIIIFFIGWLEPIFALIFSAAAVTGFFFFLKSPDNEEYSYANISVKKVMIIAAISLIWCFLAGQGGFIHQSSDHIIRNAIFRDMIKLPWPVIYDNDTLLSYYIAHWMLPAAFGKIILAVTGSVSAAFIAGRIALLIWSSIGIFIALLLISVITSSNGKAAAVLSSLMFIFFSGLDIIGTLTSFEMDFSHLEWWAGFAQFSSFTTCLFWVYNQFVVSLIITLCIINEKNPINFAFLGILVLPYGPFPFIGIVIMCAVKAIIGLVKSFGKNGLSDEIKNIFTPQNIIMAVAVGIPYGLYYMSNSIMTNDVVRDGERIDAGFRFHTELSKYISDGSVSDTASFLVKYLMFILLEAGIYFIILFIYQKKRRCLNPVFIISSASLLFIPLFQVGVSYDFAMRVSIPPLIYIAVEFIRFINSEIESCSDCKNLRSIINAKPLLTAAVMIFGIGVFNPITEFGREILKTEKFGLEKETDFEYLASLNDYDKTENFTASDYKQSLFYKYFLKK